jgi:hypothetical protein
LAAFLLWHKNAGWKMDQRFRGKVVTNMRARRAMNVTLETQLHAVQAAMSFGLKTPPYDIRSPTATRKGYGVGALANRG